MQLQLKWQRKTNMATGKIKSNFKMPTPSAADRLHAQQQQIRKTAGLPDPSEYQKMAAQKQKEIDDMKKDQEKENNPNRGRFSSGPAKTVIGTQPLVKSEGVRLGGTGGRGNIYHYDRNPEPRDGSELENTPSHPKTALQKRLNTALTDLGNKLKKTDPKLREAKDSHEYDYEGEMAINQLKTMMRHAEYLVDMIKPDTNLPEWVQSKITLAADYVQTSCDYMTSEMSEGSNFIKVIKKGTNIKQRINPNSYAAFKHHGFRKEEIEELDEISSATKASYTSKAKDQIKQSMPYTKKGEEYRDIAKNFIAKRQKGIAKANEEVVQEGRPSQRHPLEGHEYHKKSDEALIHIAKDAHAAAEAMKSHNTDAENKYRDQANDSATVRHFRKKSGMPDWYKKKYGHVNEAMVRVKTDKPIGTRVADIGPGGKEYNVKTNKAWDDAQAPFDKPYKKDTGTTIDKSGAKHTPMSKVRNLARQAMKKTADRKLQKEAEEPATEPFVKNSKQMSRKAQIVKGAAKGNGDSFQKEPVLSASVEKNQSTN